MSDFNLLDMLYVFIMFNAKGFFIMLNGGGWVVYGGFWAVLWLFWVVLMALFWVVGGLLWGCWGGVESCLFFFVN